MKTFHVVKRSHNGVFQTYAIYANNRPFLEPGRGYKLGRRAAYAIVRLLNALSH